MGECANLFLILSVLFCSCGAAKPAAEPTFFAGVFCAVVGCQERGAFFIAPRTVFFFFLRVLFLQGSRANKVFGLVRFD